MASGMWVLVVFKGLRLHSPTIRGKHRVLSGVGAEGDQTVIGKYVTFRERSGCGGVLDAGNGSPSCGWNAVVGPFEGI